MAEEKVQHTDNCVCPLACITGLINNEVHLARDGFTAHPKDSGLPKVLGNTLDQAVAGYWYSAPAAQNQKNNAPRSGWCSSDRSSRGVTWGGSPQPEE